MENPSFEVELEVRDYECDLQGIVNHAVYLHYLEHARHLLLKANGLDFAELARDVPGRDTPGAPRRPQRREEIRHLQWR